ncbi:hypothetical protein PoB_000042000 [Plakobranchus ocellatus]|uniref:Sulfatase N-terminal domain-containing protein n=1 Tax=Plakobranchus ocellatus TaxID=259542 RepID=A0AAV3XU36_9GAST|nr:hypothetical protein PoB_000042000 [Plakobranchus ocellatus]
MKVVHIGFDSTSRMAWTRNLPQTRKYFLESLGGIELEGHHILGSGTVQAGLLPLLTGMMETDLPSARVDNISAVNVDNFPWIWKEFKQAGYVNVYGEDLFRLNAFSMDEDLVEFLKMLEKQNYLNHTVLILMADHGSRITSIRSTQQGKLEERLPYFGFGFPPSFVRDYPEAVTQLRRNRKRLTTCFDVHETLHDLLDYRNINKTASERPSSTKGRGISLFREIPRSRTCAQAGVQVHWCTCLEWELVSDQSLINASAKAALDVINSWTQSFRDMCVLLQLKHVVSLRRLKVNHAVEKYNGDLDRHGDLPNFLGKMTTNIDFLQVNLFSQPGDAAFEVTIRHLPDESRFEVSPLAVSRINKYGDDPGCIATTHPHLRPFCFCKERLVMKFEKESHLHIL